MISESEFLNWLSKIKTPKESDIEEDLKAAFSVFDVDKNGQLLSFAPLLPTILMTNLNKMSIYFIRIYNERRTEVCDATDGRNH